MLDLILPDMNGWDILREIRVDGPNQTTPIIVVTVVADKSAAVGYRVDEFLVKPVVDSDLKRAGVVEGKSKDILCVDDDAGSLKLAEIALRNGGNVPICTTDSRAALKLLEKERPAAIVLDLLMPGMDGFEFLERFRRLKDTPRIPIIVWTVKDVTQEDRVRLQASVRAMVSKGPGGTAQLLEEIDIHVGIGPTDTARTE